MFRDQHPRTGLAASPAQVVMAVPETLGYHPSGELVILGYHQDEIHATVRIDLRNPPAVQLDMARYAASVLGREGLTHCAIVAFGEPDHRTVTRLVDGLAAYGMAVPYTIRAVDGRAHSCLLQDDAPTPGSAPAPLGPVDSDEQKAMRAATRTALRLIAGAYEIAGRHARDEHRRASYRFLRRAVGRYAMGDRMTDMEAATLSIQLQDPRITDHAAALICHDGHRSAHLALWADLARRATSLLRARPLALYGFATWHAGDPADAVRALKHARRCDRSDELTNALAHAVASGHPPRELRIEPPAERADPTEGGAPCRDGHGPLHR